MWPHGFDPSKLTRDASLNKLVIGPVPGAHAAYVGRNGGELLGRDGWLRLIQQRCGASVRPDAVADWLAAALADQRSAEAATAVVDEVADRLASLIATLRDPTTTTVAASVGRRAYLDVWRSLDLVVLGGGLMKGLVGERVAAKVAAALGDAGAVQATLVRVARHPEWLPLLGAARSACGPSARVVVLDGGQTTVKRALAVVHANQLTSLRVFAPLPVECSTTSGVLPLMASAATPLLDHRAGPPTEVIVSVASYVRDGRPIADRASMYDELDPREMERLIGAPVRLLHDGSAAWRGLGTEVRSAVISLGTWLGVGIGPHSEPLLPYSPHFTADAWGDEV